MMSKIDKPALLKQLFELGCHYSTQILSFNKMIGQLQEAGNTTTLAHYLELLSTADMITGIEKYAGEEVRQKASSPKLQVLNNALITAQSAGSFEGSRGTPELWGRLVESSIGAFLTNASKGKSIEIYYWRFKDKEVDFVLARGDRLVAIEVKSGPKMEKLPGLELFSSTFKNKKIRNLLVGKNGFPIEDFLQIDIEELFN